MNKSSAITRKNVTAKAVTIILAIAAAVILPQIFHAVGAISGTGKALGSALLPMHIPVLLAGLLGGSAVGITAGVISPLLSFAISGMPAAASLPFMMIELGVYGLTAGLLSKTDMNSFFKLLITQISGRAVKALAVLGAIYILGNTQLTAASIITSVTSGLFGIIIQWALIPLLTDRLSGLKKYYE